VRRSALKRKTNRWTILSLIALVIVLGGGFYYFRSKQLTPETKPVETSTIGTGNIILSATGVGTLIAKDEVSFGFKNGGQVSEVSASLGQQVKAGDVLARLDHSTLELKYTQAEATVAALSTPGGIASAAQMVQEAKEKLASAKDNLQHIIGPDMMIAEDQVASVQQDLQLAQAVEAKAPTNTNKQKVSEAEANLKKAQDALTYAYYNSSSAYTLETFTYPIRNTKGTTIRRELIAPTDAELLSARAAYELAQANLYDAQNYLDILNRIKKTDEVPTSSVTSITEAKLALDRAKADLDAADLIAPIDGIITAINLSVGQEIGASSVITISDMSQPYTIDASLDETDWDKAKVGFAATVTFDLLPNNNYSGKIIQVYPKLDDSSGTNMVHILVQLDKPIDKDLPIGSTASVDVTGGEALNVVLVPISALKEVESGKYVVYLMKNGQQAQQEVQIGLQDIIYAEVKSGLQRGDVVLTDATAVNQ
jgi:HlyD family secretion protein